MMTWSSGVVSAYCAIDDEIESRQGNSVAVFFKEKGNLFLKNNKNVDCGAKSREIESRQGKGWQLFEEKEIKIHRKCSRWRPLTL
jgi:hypothetical protein